jgi:hypothetical protein
MNLRLRVYRFRRSPWKVGPKSKVDFFYIHECIVIKMAMIQNNLHLFFHSPCFDGAVSAALASDYFERVLGSAPTLTGVNYDLKDAWLSNDPIKPFAIVDFLYHPGAEFWADHHPTTFLTEDVRRDFEAKRSSNFLYDKSASSCAILLWKQWAHCLGDLKKHYEEIVYWADLLDSARYHSVEEAVTLPSPALQINLALAIADKKDFPKKLVALLRSSSLSEILAVPEVLAPYQEGRTLQERGLERLKKTIQVNDKGIAIFDVDSTSVLVNRYAPFYFFPKARYSAGIVRDPDKAKLTIMRNPWLEFASAPLGQLCAPLGGGGHQRVGSVVMRGAKASQAGVVLRTLIDQINAWEKEQSIMGAS